MIHVFPACLQVVFCYFFASVCGQTLSTMPMTYDRNLLSPETSRKSPEHRPFAPNSEMNHLPIMWFSGARFVLERVPPQITNMTMENHHLIGDRYIFKWLFFHCHVRFREGNLKPTPGSVAAVARSYKFLADVVVDSHRDLRYLGPNEKVYEHFHKWAPDPVTSRVILRKFQQAPGTDPRPSTTCL